MGRRTNTAQWLPNQNRWQIKVQKDGVRKTFTSAKPGRTGQREANAKADAWLDEGICSTTKRCLEVWNEYLISVRATAGTSYAQQVEKFGQNYILPVVGDRRIGDLNTGMLQDVLNRAYKEGSMKPQATRKSRGNLSRKTLQGIRAVEVSFVKWARQHKYTALRPEDERLTVPRGARPKGRKILQPDALRVLLSVDTRIVRGKVEQDANIHAYRFAVLTGLRPGELLGLRVGDMVMSGPEADIKPGNALPLANIPVGTLIHAVELQPGKGAAIARSAGTSIQLMGKEGDYAILRMPSSEMRRVLITCRATVGEVGNAEHSNIKIGKAGRKRWMGVRPSVRGTVMNPVDHPHGGGEGKNKSAGRHPVTPWGVPTKGHRTRNPKKASSRLIIRRRKK